MATVVRSEDMLNGSETVRQDNGPALESDISSDSLEELDLDDLKNEQSKIDSVLNYLMNFKCQKRKVGRPKKTTRGRGKQTASTSRQESSNSPGLEVGNDNSLHEMDSINPSLLIDYLTSVNDFNKKLLKGISALSKKYDDLADRVRQVSEPSPGTEEDTPPPPPAPTNVNNVQVDSNLETRIDAIEQRENANFLLCSGSVIKDVIEGPSEVFKDNIISKIKESLPELSDREIVRVTPFGSKKSHVKVECASFKEKKKILILARQKKPTNLYFSELLTQYRSKMFYSLRSLKAKFPNKIKSVYTRDGNLFYKLSEADDFRKIRSPTEITELERRLNGTEE